MWPRPKGNVQEQVQEKRVAWGREGTRVTEVSEEGEGRRPAVYKHPSLQTLALQALTLNQLHAGDMCPIPEAGGTSQRGCPCRRWQAYRQPVLCQCHSAQARILASRPNSDPNTATLPRLPGSNTLRCPGTA